ncbi:MAG: ATP-binding protein [Mycobacterium sp.]|nr:ATP-binding protein [Mycobacterium sp.]
MASIYIPRLADGLIAELLAGFPAVLVVGPRACGKTTTAARHARTIVRLDREAEAAAVHADPDGALDVARPVLLDEWQLAPEILAAVKRAVDSRPGPNNFLITGSVRSDLEDEGWPMTGRVLRVQMYGLTEREITGDATAVPLLDRLAAHGVAALSVSDTAPSLNDYVTLALRSGFPEPVLASSERLRRQWLRAYVEQLITRDAEMVDAGRDPARLRRYLHALCLNTAGVVDAKTLYDSAGVNRKTALAYDKLLSNLLVVDAVPAWWTNRLKRLVQTPKRYVIDPGVVGAVLRLDVPGVRRDGDLLGRLLDTFVMAQLRAEASICEAEPSLYHLRSEQGRHEVDIVIEYSDGRVFGLEIKATSGPSLNDAKHLKWLRDELGDRFIGGVVLHAGPRLYPLAQHIAAAPICSLWE